MLRIAYCVANIIRHCELLRADLEMRRSKSVHINKYKIVCVKMYMLVVVIVVCICYYY